MLAPNRWLLFCLGSALAVSACAADPGDDRERVPVVLFERPIACEIPAPGFVAEIEQRLTVAGGSLRGARTARSYETWGGDDAVWFPTVIEGPGLERGDDVGAYLHGALVARLNEPTLHETSLGGGERVWFLAADIEGPGFEGPGHVAVWATTADRRRIEAVNHLARVFSTWGSDVPLFGLGYEDVAMTAVADCVETALGASARSG